ncbi:Protein of unknown function [Robiginitalea myxolifaciens]|uniref:Uncharacterized protein n=1 Tax=Robiginitalea myxolifaciens TaxID=400055 RepID=A0A1I6H134_9FLAO|nr:DUF2911 domain-containing protein [Robiginitalea myxolifaciens]SFR48138.1 Protein of unknown function [Robiginitalea myxolifaciens]
MKQTFLLAAALLSGLMSWGQIQVPQPSPSSMMKQTVGLTQVTVEYSRPSMRGRTIFGDLVPYDAIWRTGANMNTTISFSDPVTVSGTTLEAGTYAIYTKPGMDSWEVYFYTDTNNGGLPRKWDDSKVAATATTQVYKMEDPVQTFTITIDNLTNNGAVIGMLWENVYVGVPFEVPTATKAQASVEAVMSGPSANDYFQAASYYHDEGMDLAKAKEWIDKAVAANPKAFWMSRRQSLIYAAMGDTKGAIAAAKKSLAAAEDAGNNDYIKMNKDSLKEWGAM